jgi:hypothetical protein
MLKRRFTLAVALAVAIGIVLMIPQLGNAQVYFGSNYGMYQTYYPYSGYYGSSYGYPRAYVAPYGYPYIYRPYYNGYGDYGYPRYYGMYPRYGYMPGYYRWR